MTYINIFIDNLKTYLYCVVRTVYAPLIYNVTLLVCDKNRSLVQGKLKMTELLTLSHSTPFTPFHQYVTVEIA